MLRVTKDELRGAKGYYGRFYVGDKVFHTAYVLRTGERGEDVLCYDNERKAWSTMDRAGFEELLGREKDGERFSALSEQDALWFLEMNEAINGEGDDEKVAALLAEWTEKKEQYRDAWDSGHNWPAKYVQTTFYLKGKQYSITPDSIGLEKGECWDEGFMEFIQADIGEDLKKLGATEIRHMGFLD